MIRFIKNKFFLIKNWIKKRLLRFLIILGILGIASANVGNVVANPYLEHELYYELPFKGQEVRIYKGSPKIEFYDEGVFQMGLAYESLDRSGGKNLLSSEIEWKGTDYSSRFVPKTETVEFDVILNKATSTTEFAYRVTGEYTPEIRANEIWFFHKNHIPNPNFPDLPDYRIPIPEIIDNSNKKAFGTLSVDGDLIKVTPPQSFMEKAEYPVIVDPDVAVDTSVTLNDARFVNTSPQLVWTSDTEGFLFYIDGGEDLLLASTTDSGATWGNFITIDSVNTNDVLRVAVWYDQWTPGDSGNLIHVVTLDTGAEDTYYTEYNTTTNSVATTVITGTEAAALGDPNHMTITKAEDGDLYVAAADAVDSWVHTCSATCTNGANWSAITSPWSANSDDQIQLLPLVGTDNIVLIDWDPTNDDIESNIYSATSSSWWGWDTSINQNEPDNSIYYGDAIGATFNPTTGEIYLAYVGDADDYTTQDHDIEIWEFNNSTFAWTQKTNVVTNASGGINSVKLILDENNGDLYALYSRRTTITDGSSSNVYTATSTDNGSTWSSENGPWNTTEGFTWGVNGNLMSNERIGAMWKYSAPGSVRDDLYYVNLVDLEPSAPEAPAEEVSNSQIIGFLDFIIWWD